MKIYDTINENACKGEIYLENQELVNLEDQNLETKKVFRRAGFALFIMLLVTMVSQVLMTMLLNQFAPGIEESPWFFGLLIGIPFYFLGFPVFLWIMRKIPNAPKRETKKISFKNMVFIFLISMAATYIFNIVGILVNTLISFLKGTDVLNPLEGLVGTSSIIPTIIFIGILSPIIEEIVFRGVLLNKLRVYGDKTAVWFTALTFALFHGNLSQFFYALALGLIFGYLVIRTNTIRYAIILHIIVNLFGSVIMPALALSGNIVLEMSTGILVFFFIITGTILFIKNFKKIKLGSIENSIDKKVSKRTAYWNIGMIFYYIVCLGMFVSVIMV